jgi:hypothetical protein
MKDARRGRAINTAGPIAIPTGTQQYQELTTSGIYITISRGMGELHERMDSQSIGNLHHFSFRTESDRATNKGMGSKTHHIPLGPPTPDLDIKKWGTT